MSYLLFIDESGTDAKSSNYEILAGIAVQDKNVWPLVKDFIDLEFELFGLRYDHWGTEVKGSKFLKRKVFRHASQEPELSVNERRLLSVELLADPDFKATQRHLAALAQSKLAFVKQTLALCKKHECKVFAAINLNAPRTINRITMLRKDYVYLFERFYYYLSKSQRQGVVVFDELDISKSLILKQQMSAYFIKSGKGRKRSNLVIPECLFVHSDLTTGVQIADIIAYIINFGLRLKPMQKPAREELKEYAEMVMKLRYKTTVKGEDGLTIPISSVQTLY